MKLCWQQIGNETITEIMCNVDYCDGVVLDLEHGCYNEETLFRCIQIASLIGKKCFVRCTEVNKKLLRSCLDFGCTGLIFAMIEEESQCSDIFKYSRYPQQGGVRGLGLVRQNDWGRSKKLVKEPPVLIAQIETSLAVKNINSIKNSKVFDFFMIGPYDLSSSLGIPGNFDNKLYTDTVEEIKNKIGVENMAVHIPTNVKNELKKYHNYGIIALGMDTIFLADKMKETFKNA